MKHKIVQVNWRDPKITYEDDKNSIPKGLNDLEKTISYGWIIAQDEDKTVIGHVDYGTKVDKTVVATRLIERTIKKRSDMDHNGQIVEVVFRSLRRDRSVDRGVIDRIKNLNKYLSKEVYAYGWVYRETNRHMVLVYEENEDDLSYIPICLEDIIKINKR